MKFESGKHSWTEASVKPCTDDPLWRRKIVREFSVLTTVISLKSLKPLTKSVVLKIYQLMNVLNNSGLFLTNANSFIFRRNLELGRVPDSPTRWWSCLVRPLCIPVHFEHHANHENPSSLREINKPWFFSYTKKQGQYGRLVAIMSAGV